MDNVIKIPEKEKRVSEFNKKEIISMMDTALLNLIDELEQKYHLELDKEESKINLTILYQAKGLDGDILPKKKSILSYFNIFDIEYFPIFLVQMYACLFAHFKTRETLNALQLAVVLYVITDILYKGYKGYKIYVLKKKAKKNLNYD